eukprot:1136927-Pelagomonas_calceolata.AAC.7
MLAWTRVLCLSISLQGLLSLSFTIHAIHPVATQTRKDGNASSLLTRKKAAIKPLNCSATIV